MSTFDAAMRPAFLRRVAEETGGRFYTPATVSTLPEDITYMGRGVTVSQEKDLWDMPVLMVLLVGPGRGRMAVASPLGAAMRCGTLAAVVFAALAFVGPWCDSATAQPGAPAMAQQGSGANSSYLLVVVGLGGDAENADRFHTWAAAIVDAARNRYALPPDHVTYLGEDPSRDTARISGRSTREGITASVARIAASARPGDRVLIVLIGHGASATGGARFNLPGPRSHR